VATVSISSSSTAAAAATTDGAMLKHWPAAGTAMTPPLDHSGAGLTATDVLTWIICLPCSPVCARRCTDKIEKQL